MSEELLTKAAIRERGWSETMIRDLLGEPDRTKANPYNRKSRTSLYLLRRVTEAESHPAFAEKAARASARSEAATNVARAKTAKNLDAFASIEIPVHKLAVEDLLSRAIDHYNERNNRRVTYASLEASPDFLKRIARNFVRHELTRYEDVLSATRGVIGRAAIYTATKGRVLNEVDKTYPDLDRSIDEILSRTRQSQIASMR